MACSYCATSGVPGIPEAGSCVECQRTACAYPSLRHDGKFHGYSCECQCNQFVCRVHFSRHSRNHKGGTPAKCFPLPTTVSSVGALAVIEKQLGPTFDIALPISEKDAISDFVQHFLASPRPGPQRPASESSGLPVYLVDPKDLDSLPGTLRDRVELAGLAPPAANYLAFAWENLKQQLDHLPDEYRALGQRVASMNKVLPLPERLNEPLGARAIDAYTELSPRIGAALAYLFGRHAGWLSIYRQRIYDTEWLETPVPSEAEVLSAFMPMAAAAQPFARG